MTSTNWGVDKYIISNKKITKGAINEIFTQELIFSLILYVVCITLFRDKINLYTKLDDSGVFWALLLFIFVYNPLSRPKAILEKNMLFLNAYVPALAAHFLGCSLGFLFLYMGYGIWSMVAWKMAVIISEYVLLLLLTPDRPKLNFQFENLNTHIIFCLPLFLGGVLSFFSVTADIWIVNSLLGPFELGLYWLAFSTSHLVLSARALINRMLLPFLSQAVSLEEKIELFSRLNGFLQITLVGITVFVSYWGPDAFVLVFGAKWSEAGNLFIILFYAVAFKFISGTANSLLHSFMKTGIDLNIAFTNACILIPLLVAFTHFGGVLGTSIAVLVSTIVMTVYVYEVYVRKLCKRGFLYFFSYLSINLISLLCIKLMLSEYLDDLIIRFFTTGGSILIAYMTLLIPSISSRKLSLKQVFVRQSLF